MSNDRLYYDFKIINNTNTKLVLDQTDRRLNNLIYNPTDYSISILKFSLPTESLEGFSLPNCEDYQIKLTTTIDSNNVMSNISATNSFPSSSEFNYINYQDFLEAFNRTSLKSHRDLLQAFHPQCKNVITKSGSFNINKTSSPYTYEHPITLSPNDFNDGTNSMGISNKLGYLKFGFKSGYTSDNRKHPIRLYLQDPSGLKCLIYSGLNTSINNTLIFEDCSFNSLDLIEDYTQDIPVGIYQPREAMLKLNNVSGSDGTWKIILESTSFYDSNITNNNFNQSCNYTINFYFLPKGLNNEISVNQYAPTLRLSDTDLLQFYLHQSIFLNNNSILLSPKLYNVLGFPGYLDSSGLYKLKLPQIILEYPITETSFIEYNQAISTVYKLVNIRAIQIRTNCIPVIGEYSLYENSSIIMSIDITTDAQKDRYEYQSSLHRWYNLVGDAPISDINFSIWIVYNSGEVKQAYIPPYNKFTLLCIFCKNDKTFN